MSSQIGADQLVADLREFAAKLGETPTRTQMNEDGPHSSTPFYSEWGSWNAALEAAGLTANHREDITDEELCEELRRLAEELDRLPRFEDMAEHGAFSPHTYTRRFGSWSDAKDAAGLDEETRTSRRIPERALIAALWDLRDELGRTPTQEDMKELGDFSHRPYYRAFDSWNAALEAAGFDPNHENEIAEDALVEAMQKLAEEFGRAPTQPEMVEEGRYSVEPYYRAFGSWVAAKEEAELETTEVRPNGRVPREKLVDALQSLAEDLEKTPSRKEMDIHGFYSREPYEREFGSWPNALRAAEFEPLKEHNIPDERLLEELQTLADEIGRTPTQSEMNEDGSYYATTYEMRFGSWNDAVEEAGLDVIRRVGVANGQVKYGSNWSEQREKALERDDWLCQDCGITNEEHLEEDGQGLHVHHLTKRRKFDGYEEANQLENLVTLCRKCHTEWEKRSYETAKEIKDAD